MESKRAVAQSLRFSANSMKFGLNAVGKKGFQKIYPTKIMGDYNASRRAFPCCPVKSRQTCQAQVA
jgi:hypothetical protein